jgi:hypothetical protein
MDLLLKALWTASKCATLVGSVVTVVGDSNVHLLASTACDLVIAAIGYNVPTLDERLAPLDPAKNCVQNTRGRVGPGL